MTKIFVYGSLVTGSRYHQHYLGTQTLLGKGHIDGYGKYVLGGLHGIVPEDGKQIQGEVYEIDAAALAKLDHLHNLGSMFTRSDLEVQLENGGSLTAEAFIWTRGVGR